MVLAALRGFVPHFQIALRRSKDRVSIVNYGYNDSTPAWKGHKAAKLVAALGPLVEEFNRMTPANAYLETDGLYGGVRIRRITAASEDLISTLVDQADRLYDSIMTQEGD